MRDAKRSTKKSLLASGISLLVCFALLIGTTFAWFTDSVTNSGNKIQAGTLDIGLDELSSDGNYVPVGENPIFDYELWEPGYSDVAVLRVSNLGSLALKFNLQLIANGDAGRLGDVIDVYALVQEGTAITTIPKSLDTAIAAGYEKVGTLNELMADPDGAAYGVLYAANNKPVDGYSEVYAGIVLHMQETAGNDYQGLSVGTTFDIQLNAIQYTYEKDGFGDSDYDAEASVIQVGADTASLLSSLENAKPGDVLSLPAVTYELSDPISIPSGVTLKGVQAGNYAGNWAEDDNADKTVITVSGSYSSSRLLLIEQNTGSAVSDVVLDGIMIDGQGKDLKGIFVKKYDGIAMTGIAIRNCAVIDCGNDGIDVGNTNGAVIENNYVSDIYDNGITLNSYDNPEGIVSYIRNNIVKNIQGTINGAIAVSGGEGDVIISGNVVENIGSNGQVTLPAVDMGESAIVVESVFEGGVITIENNTLNNVGQGIAVYKFSAPAEDDMVVIRNNNVTGYTTFAIATSSLNYAKLAAIARVEVTGNIFSAFGTATKDGLYVETTNRYNETTSDWSVVASGNTSGNGTYTSE